MDKTFPIPVLAIYDPDNQAFTTQSLSELRVDEEKRLLVNPQDKPYYPEHRNSFITTSGVEITVTRSDNKDIQLALIKNPSRGLRANLASSVVYAKVKGNSPANEGYTINRGEAIYIPGVISNLEGLKLDSNNNNVNVEVVLWG